MNLFSLCDVIYVGKTPYFSHVDGLQRGIREEHWPLAHVGTLASACS